MPDSRPIVLFAETNSLQENPSVRKTFAQFYWSVKDFIINNPAAEVYADSFREVYKLATEKWVKPLRASRGITPVGRTVEGQEPTRCTSAKYVTGRYDYEIAGIRTPRRRQIQPARETQSAVETEAVSAESGESLSALVGSR